MNGVVPTQKALQGSETELLGEMKKNNVVTSEGSLICPPDKSIICISQKKAKKKKDELVAIPDDGQQGV